jgi:hypothetical protein
MANTRVQQTSLVTTNLADNTSKAISPLKHREVELASVEAAAFVDDINTFSDVNTHTAEVRWHKGSAIASSAELELGNTGNFHHVTGNVTITAISNKQHGTRMLLYFNSNPVLAHSASLRLPNATNITVIPQTLYEFISEGSGNWRMLNNDSLHGVVITSPADNEVLQYDSTTSTWVNVGLGTALGNSIGSSGSSNQVLQTDGSGGLSWATNGGPTLAQFIRNSTETQASGTVETINKTLLIPANTFTANSAFKILVRIRKDNQGFNIVVTRIYISSNPAVFTGGSAFALGNYSFPAVGSRTGTIMERSLLIINATTLTSYVFDSTSLPSDVNTTNGVITSNAIDWTVNQYVVVTTVSSNASYSAFIRSIQITPQ